MLIVASLADQDVRRVVDETVKAIEGTVPASATRARAEGNLLYWQRLEAGGEYLYRLRRIFERARSKGTIECDICDNGFQPKALRVVP